jgi:ABC-type transport system involved in cytochrome c biogenesis permease subunit
MQTTWAYISNYSIYSAMAVFALSLLAHAFETAWAVRAPELAGSATGTTLNKTLDYTRTERAARIATAMMVLGFLLLLVGVIARGISNGHVPWGNMYEFSITGALAFTAAIISGGVFLLSNVIAGAFLYLDAMERRGERKPWAKRLPELETLDQLSYRLVAFVFPLWTFSVIAGAIWAESAWGRYWGWDPKETWAFITWVAYAAYLHARVTVGWRGRRAAWLCLFAGSTFLFNYVYVNVWGTGKHTYSGL